MTRGTRLALLLLVVASVVGQIQTVRIDSRANRIERNNSTLATAVAEIADCVTDAAATRPESCRSRRAAESAATVEAAITRLIAASDSKTDAQLATILAALRDLQRGRRVVVPSAPSATSPGRNSGRSTPPSTRPPGTSPPSSAASPSTTANPPSSTDGLLCQLLRALKLC